MKKIVIAQDINKKLQKRNSFLNRSDIKVLPAASLNEAMEIHRAIRVDLIIARLDMPGMKRGRFCSLVKEQAGPAGVSILLICPDSSSAVTRSKHCGADALLFEPVKTRKILARAKQLLNLSWRETYRILLSVAVEGTAHDRSFSCRSLDISATGMLLETAHTFGVGGRLSCSLFLPDATRIEAEGEIVRTIPKLPGTGENLYGVRFVTIAPDAQEALEALARAASAGANPAAPKT